MSAPAVTLRVALRFAYDGTAFASYARNPGTSSVEAALLHALAREGLVDGTFRTGSRTDAGVSALANVCAADLERPHLRGLLPALQTALPAGLWATGAATVAPEWNPRHAVSRTYRLHWRGPVASRPAMRKAAALFVGEHDMTAFAKVEAGRTPTRKVLAFTVGGTQHTGWTFRVRGESFLWNQVRRMVAAVVAVGAGSADASDITAALRSGRPHPRFGLAPAEGLVLERVSYRGVTWDSAAGAPRLAGEALAAARTRLAVVQHVARAVRVKAP